MITFGLCAGDSAAAPAATHRGLLQFGSPLFSERRPALKDTLPVEHYIDPTVNLALNLIVPKTLRDGLNFDAGYDRWVGLPTVRADYFLPVKAWSDRSLFVTPRVHLSGQTEELSLGAGVRQLLGERTMVGVHAFHDWVRPRGGYDAFLKEAGMGLELSALPGRHSDLTLSLNAYLPVNERRTHHDRANLLVKETLPLGWDAKLGLLLPPLYKPLDIRLHGQYHSYRAERTNLSGYKAGLSVSSRDGMFGVTAERGSDSVLGDGYTVYGTLTLAFDWAELVKGKNPFSAPYKASDVRFSRDLRNSLHERVVRRHDLPADRTETPVQLVARVNQESVAFSGGFPGLPHSRVVVQASQSPWRDIGDVITDAHGFYRGVVRLEPGTYRLRLIHKETGTVSDAKTVVIR